MKKESQFVEIPGEWNISYRYSAGLTAGRFFSELKDGPRFLGTRCPKCNRVYLPPRSFCERCFVKIEDWVDLGFEGTIETFTLVQEKFEGFPDPPYVVAFVKIEGADTSIVNFIEGVDLSNKEEALKKVTIGMKVRADFKEKREGRMTDFVFKPI